MTRSAISITLGVRGFRQDDPAHEQFGPFLRADPQCIAKAACNGEGRSARPCRSSRALVATVVPIRTAAGGNAPTSVPLNCRMPAIAASSARAGLSDNSLAVSTWPSGARATTSVKVPPRSIQNCHSPATPPSLGRGVALAITFVQGRGPAGSRPPFGDLKAATGNRHQRVSRAGCRRAWAPSIGNNPLTFGQPLPSIASDCSKHCFCLAHDAARHAHAQFE